MEKKRTMQETKRKVKMNASVRVKRTMKKMKRKMKMTTKKMMMMKMMRCDSQDKKSKRNGDMKGS